ncbi:hypothetical protein TorRG33x02_119440, partial [Trema orientale]
SGNAQAWCHKDIVFELDGVNAFRKTVKGFIEVKRLSRSIFLWSRSLLSNTFSSSSTTASNFLLMGLSGLGHPCIIDKREAHKTESLVVDLNTY